LRDLSTTADDLIDWTAELAVKRNEFTLTISMWFGMHVMSKHFVKPTLLQCC